MNGFEDLTPDKVIYAAEQSLNRSFTGLINPLPSYINRVYELEADSGERIIAKFYRPGRWSLDAILDEHEFIMDCAEAEIPVVSPLILEGEGTLSEEEDIFFALFPKKSGRLIELNDDEDWVRLGAIIGRMHKAGEAYDAEHRIVLDPRHSLKNDIEELLSGEFIPEPQRSEFQKITDSLFQIITPLFEGAEQIRIHGDCHAGNILERPGEGLMLIDFDDMVTGPPVHDLWLLLPGLYDECQKEFFLLVAGYEQFRDFDMSSVKLIEPLRAMRMIYFTAWCARQVDDFKFQKNFPHWGTPAFWTKEISDLEVQIQVILKSLEERESF